MNDPFRIGVDWLQARAKASPLAPALVVDDRAYSFSGLDALVSRLCGVLAAAGVAPGQHVGLLLPNSAAFVCAVFALARLHCVAVPLNTRLTSSELAWQIERADCARLITADSLEAVGHAAAGGRVPLHILPAAAAAFEAWLTTQAADAPAHSVGDFHSPQAIVFTSGTTGFPKAAIITHANQFWSAIGSAFKLGVRPDDCWLACLPLYHVGGLAILLRSCLYGTGVILHDGFQTEAVMSSLQRHAPTIVSLVPTMLHRLLEAGLTAAVAPSLRLVLLGGAAASPELLARATDAGLPVAVTYGLTEACSQVATMLPNGARAKPGSTGRPLLFTQVEVVGDDGCPVPNNTPGEIVVGGPTVMAGYYTDPDATAVALPDGRLHTGDIGYLDPDGDLWVLDRRSDLIVTGGENVYPAEVERVLRAHPAVAAACVVGLPHPEWGQQPAAVIVLKRPGAATEDDLLAHCRAHLAGFKQPRTLRFAEALPLTGSGKVARRAVVEMFAAQQKTG